MIHKFTAQNFYSFKNKIEIDFDVNNNAPDNAGYVMDSNRKLSKILAVIGPNASGKTNLLKVLSFIKFFITSSFSLKPDQLISFSSFEFAPNKDEPTEVSVTFSHDAVLYEYFLSLDQNQVFDERLRKFNKNTKQFSILFKRTWDKSKNDYDYDLSNFITSTKIKNIVKKRKNASLISIASQIDHKISNEIIGYWNQFESNVVELGKHEHPFMVEAAKYYYDNPDAKELAESLLTKFDLGLTQLLIERHSTKSKSGEEEVYYIPVAFHKGDRREYTLPFLLESGGTKSLFSILRQIIPVLLNGGIAVLDEFDADLHPLMLPELINLFTSKYQNPKNAQLLFSTHHHEILNKLDKYQVILVEKNKDSGSSETWRLDQIKGIRSDDNYYSKYISGTYGGVPEI